MPTPQDREAGRELFQHWQPTEEEIVELDYENLPLAEFFDRLRRKREQDAKKPGG